MLSRAGAGLDVRIVELATIPPSVWDSVAPARRTPMQAYIWASTAAEIISPDRPIEVVTVGSPDAPCALAPLTATTVGARRSRLLGAVELGEPVEVIYKSEEALSALADGLARLGRPLNFGHYLRETPFLAHLRKAHTGRGIVVSRTLPMRAAPFIELSEAWIEPEQTFTSGRRSDFRRMQRKAAKLGGVQVNVLSPSIDEVDTLIDEVINVEARSWKGAARTAIAFNPIQERFYRLYARRASAAGILRISFLRIGGSCAAVQLAVEIDSRFWLLKIGYDEAFKACSPGNILLRESIRYAAQRKLLSFEFLGKEAAWTTVWTNRARPIVALRTYPYNFTGLRALSADVAHTVKGKLSNTAQERGGDA